MQLERESRTLRKLLSVMIQRVWLSRNSPDRFNKVDMLWRPKDVAFFETRVERRKRKVREEHARRKLIRKFKQQEAKAAARGARPPKRAESYFDAYGAENDPFMDLYDQEELES
mmetsp:Transcript_4505/g.6739  ORF Transcript_4505/g.6739 Transcript_4505/m.6739 type:complete len:114 (-) Transcript_4505:128-469(-)